MDGILDEISSGFRTDDRAEPAPVLEQVRSFGPNDGNLSMRLYRPNALGKRRPLVVVLHGCTQTAAGFGTASGWLRLADELKFMVLLPEQKAENNRQTCFSWFEAGDIRRGSGEVASIAEMIDMAVTAFDADRDRIFICGLSAGGAMAAAMLATYPELFQGGAMIAGLPYGTATSTSEALDSMYSGKIKEAKVWGDIVRSASKHTGPWPSVAIWHGTEDRVVKPINAGELVKQWTNVHGVGGEAPAEDQIGRTTRRVWRDGRKLQVVTEYSVAGLGHGVPVDDASPPAPFFIPAGLSSTWHIAKDWNLTRDGRERRWLEFFGVKL